MNLYHYSSELYSRLETRAVSKSMSEKEIRKARSDAASKPWFQLPYCDHISFFFEPIPASLLPRLYPKDHHTWRIGNVLYEYVIDIKTLPMRLKFEVVESPAILKRYDEFSIERNWTEKDPVILKDWMLLENQLMREFGLYGESRSSLERVIPQFDKGISEYYIRASQREDFADNKYKYASCVPHLMLYPPSGIVNPTSVNQLILGTDKRTSVSIPTIPSWLR